MNLKRILFLSLSLFILSLSKLTFAYSDKICFDGVDENFNCLNQKEKTVSDYFNSLGFNYLNWQFNQWIDFRTWKISKPLSSYKAWTTYSYSIWADFSNKSTTSLSTLIARNGGTYHHLLIDHNADLGQQYLAVHNNAWFKSSFSTKNLTGWQNIIVVVDPLEPTEKTKFYINWSFVWSVNTAINSDSYPISILWNVSSNWTQNSMPLDEFGLWNRKLTPSEVSQLQYSLASSISDGLIYRDSFDNIEDWISYTSSPWFSSMSYSELRPFIQYDSFYQNKIWFSNIEIPIIRDFNTESGSSLNQGYHTTEVFIDSKLFKDLFFDFNSNYLVYLARGIEESKTFNWYKKVFICWQEKSLLNTKNFNCRTYFTEKETLWSSSSRTLEFSLPTLNSLESFKMNISSLSLTHNKLCFKDTNSCLVFDFNKGSSILSKTPNNEYIKSHSTYFNNQLAYINSSWILNLNNKVYLKEPYDTNRKIYLYWFWNKLLLQEWDTLTIYNENLDEIASYSNINIKDLVSIGESVYFSNWLQTDKLYKLDINGQLETKDFWIEIQSKLFVKDFYLYFSSNKVVYKLNLETDVLYKKEWLIEGDSEWFYLFWIDRENWKEEFIIFN